MKLECMVLVMVCLGVTVRVHAYIYVLILLLVLHHHQTLSLNNNMANRHLYIGHLSPVQATHTHTHTHTPFSLTHSAFTTCNKLVTVGPVAVIIVTVVHIIPLKSLQCMSLQVQ